MCNRKKLAVIGSPIKHSLSPVMHNSAIKSSGLDLQYTAVKVDEAGLAAFIQIARKEYMGFNVTVPLKKKIIPFLDKVDPNSILAESVNTVSIDKNGILCGYTTDGYGLAAALKELFSIKIKDSKFMFIGCGGAAQAVSTYLLSNRASKVFFLNRTVQKAEFFAEKLNRNFGKSRVQVSSPENKEGIFTFLKEKPIIIQSTSLGLNESDRCPLDDDFFMKDLIYFDMIYNRETKFLAKAKEHECLNADGKLMLLYQGVKSFTIWTGKNPPVEVMKNALFPI